jgi:hypothetical protein
VVLQTHFNIIYSILVFANKKLDEKMMPDQQSKTSKILKFTLVKNCKVLELFSGYHFFLQGEPKIKLQQ